MSGVGHIYAERFRQMEVEGWTPEHDDMHSDGELARAAACYLEAALIVEAAPRSISAAERALERLGGRPADDDLAQMRGNPARHYFGWDQAPPEWPWEISAWKPSPDPARNLAKAGALIAAELDRLERATAIASDHTVTRDEIPSGEK